jgi:hypothetical protein
LIKFKPKSIALGIFCAEGNVSSSYTGIESIKVNKPSKSISKILQTNPNDQKKSLPLVF